METLLGIAIFGSYVWAIIIIGLLLISFIWSEMANHGGIGFIGVVAFLIINYFWGNIPIHNIFTFVNILLFIGIGLCFAIVRTYFYGRKIRKSNTEHTGSGSSRFTGEQLLEFKRKHKEVLLEDLKGKVFRWWFMWPTSLIYWIATDLLVDVFDVLYKQMRKTFEYFFNLGYNSED